MRVALTGTPGTGKTTASEPVADRLGLDVVHLGELVDRDGALVAARDEDRDTREVDVAALRERLADRDDVLFEGHLAHHLEVDHCVVLRCDPAVLEDRLRERGYDGSKVAENAESEALDVLLAEAVERCGEDAVAEVDSTGRSVEAVADAVADAIRERRADWGDVAWTEYMAAMDVDAGGAASGSEVSRSEMSGRDSAGVEGEGKGDGIGEGEGGGSE